MRKTIKWYRDGGRLRGYLIPDYIIIKTCDLSKAEQKKISECGYTLSAKKYVLLDVWRLPIAQAENQKELRAFAEKQLMEGK